MRPGLGRRTRSRGAGPNAARALQLRRTKGQPRPTSSGPSARLRARARAWFCPAARPRHDLAPERDRPGGRAWRACPRPGGPGGLASVEATCGPGQHHPPAASGQGARVEPRREHLAVHARELDLQPDLLLLRRHPRSLLRRVEQAHRSALAHHVHRLAGLGSPVLINGTWYHSPATKAFVALCVKWATLGLAPEEESTERTLGRSRGRPSIETPVAWGRWSHHPTPPLKHVAPVPNFGMPPRVGSSNPTRGGLSAPHTVHHDGPCRRVRLSGPELCTIGASRSGSRHGTALGAVCRLLPPGLVVKQQGR